MLNYTIRFKDGCQILDLSGILDVNSVDNFRDIIEGMIVNDSLMVNLELVSTVTASGLDALVEVSMEAKKIGRRIILLMPGDELIRMVETLDYSDFLIFAYSFEEGAVKLKYFTG